LPEAGLLAAASSKGNSKSDIFFIIATFILQETLFFKIKRLFWPIKICKICLKHS
jgi:hypothetical protein